MTEISLEQINVNPLRQEIRTPVQAFAAKLLEDLSDNLQSFCVIGSALTPDFDPKRSDINTVLVVGRRSYKLLQLLASYGKRMGKQKLQAPLLMTGEYIQQSLDVFAVEFLDFQLNHAVVYGPDPFAELAFRKQDVRLQCERELKAALIRLRQGYIRQLGRYKAVGQLLMGCVAQSLPILRAMLWLVDIERPTEARATVQMAAKQFEFDGDAISKLLTMKQQDSLPGPGQIESMFENVYQVLEHLSRQVDQLRTT